MLLWTAILALFMLIGTSGTGSRELPPEAMVSSATPMAELEYAHPEWLLDGAGLQELLAADPAVKVVALTPNNEFEAGHIPGAAHIDWPELEIVETSDQRVSIWRAEVEQILTGLGLSPSDTIVIYDGGTLYAPRLWWVLDQLGHADKRILNGGLASWVNAGGPLETGPSTVRTAAEPYTGTPDERAIATIDEVQSAFGDPGVVLVDARPATEYASGHIPGAVNIPFTQNTDDSGIWKSVTDLALMYSAAGVTPDKDVIPYCTTGVRSAATYFTLKLIGYERVSLFTGSFKEWSSDPGRSVSR